MKQPYYFKRGSESTETKILNVTVTSVELETNDLDLGDYHDNVIVMDQALHKFKHGAKGDALAIFWKLKSHIERREERQSAIYLMPQILSSIEVLTRWQRLPHVRPTKQARSPQGVNLLLYGPHSGSGDKS